MLSVEVSDRLKLPGSTEEPRVSYFPHSLPKLVGDARRLNQVLVILVTNALKFTKRGKIRIRACYLS